MRYWTTALGKRRKFDKIGHQHLSNILWFKEVFNKATYSNDGTYRELLKELDYRFGGKRKPWKPLPIPTEIDGLIQLGLIVNEDIVFKGRKIGSIKHIK
jgi:hypothetical protein